MQVYWLQQTEGNMPSGDDWLSASELSRLDGMHIPKRRADWRLGRWTAKLAIATYLEQHQARSASAADRAELHNIELRPLPSGAPDVLVGGEPANLVVSLTHTSGMAMCAVAPAGVALGCDMETVEEHSKAFVADYFTTQEQELVCTAAVSQRALFATLLWSAKESALKALGEGLRLDTRSVAVKLATPIPAEALREATWSAIQVASECGRKFHGWWQRDADIVRTLVANPAPYQPIEMRAFDAALEPRSILDDSRRP